MLKLAAYPAEGFLADAEVRCNVPERNPFQYMRRLQQNIFI